MSPDPVGGGFDPANPAVPVCPRHPDRESYVRCQRCERPTCPECQRPAAVGIQCVDCVRAAAKSLPAVRTQFGGRVRTDAPRVTQGLIGICVAVFALQWTAGSGLTDSLAFYPPLAIVEPYRFLTAAFLHSPTFVLHIVMNMYALWIIGPYLEANLGRARFAALYLVSALGGSVGFFVVVPASLDSDSSWLSGAVGASGAVFGLFAAVVIVSRRLGRDISGVVGVIGLNVVLGFWPGLNIAWQAHLGGLLTGAAVMAVLAAGWADRRPARQWAGVGAVLVVLVLLVTVKTALLGPEVILLPGIG